ncbi:hypothetical protein B0H17DRAFT_1244308 [Mycena rosella]|uniref:Uncharacterized protein n=1 Tax=Mycena rosella TaxID=1033263 RepID=A0AAD7GPM6_MYCRO|nr:hypothetical protein B0H17DRAFT_1244308 [Mycena rosella]
MAGFPVDPESSKAIIASGNYVCTEEASTGNYSAPWFLMYVILQVFAIVSMLSEFGSVFYRPKNKKLHAAQARKIFFSSCRGSFYTARPLEPVVRGELLAAVLLRTVCAVRSSAAPTTRGISGPARPVLPARRTHRPRKSQPQPQPSRHDPSPEGIVGGIHVLRQYGKPEERRGVIQNDEDRPRRPHPPLLELFPGPAPARTAPITSSS